METYKFFGKKRITLKRKIEKEEQNIMKTKKAEFEFGGICVTFRIDSV